LYVNNASIKRYILIEQSLILIEQPTPFLYMHKLKAVAKFGTHLGKLFEDNK